MARGAVEGTYNFARRKVPLISGCAPAHCGLPSRMCRQAVGRDGEKDRGSEIPTRGNRDRGLSVESRARWTVREETVERDTRKKIYKKDIVEIPRDQKLEIEWKNGYCQGGETRMKTLPQRRVFCLGMREPHCYPATNREMHSTGSIGLQLIRGLG